MGATGICCWKLSLQTEGKILASILITIDIIKLSLLVCWMMQIFGLINPLELDVLLSSITLPDISATSMGKLGWYTVVAGLCLVPLVFAFLDFGMNIMLLFAVAKADHHNCTLWRRYRSVLIILTALSLIFSMFGRTLQFSLIYGVSTFLFLLLQAYALIVISSLINDIKNNPSKYSVRVENNMLPLKMNANIKADECTVPMLPLNSAETRDNSFQYFDMQPQPDAVFPPEDRTYQKTTKMRV